MMENIFNWVRYSGIWVTLILNPFHWRVAFNKNPYDTEWPAPDRTEIQVQIFMLSIRLVTDTGRW
jgi:hypothetical protein